MNLRQLLFLKAAIGSGSTQLIERTATGNPVYFSTNVQKSLTQFTIPFTCWQSGSGDPSPSNVRPIIGYSAFNIAHFNKNDIVFSATESTANGLSWEVDDDGNVIYTGTPTSYSGINVGIYNVKGGETIHGYLVGDIDNVKFDDAWIYDESWNHIGTVSTGWTGQRTPQDQGTIDLSEYPDAAYVSIILSRDLDNVAMSGICFPVVGEDLSVPDIHDIQFPDTVYGGTIDVITGVMSIEWVKYKLSDLGWAYSTYNNANVFRSDEISNIYSFTNKVDVICDKLASENTIVSYASAANWENYTVGVYRVSENSVRIFVKDTDTTSQSAFITQFGSAEIVLKLNTPVTVQLDPVAIQTLIGTNTIWTNTNGTNTVKYVKKPTYVDETGYEHENIDKLTFIGNPYAFSMLTVYFKPNLIELPAIDKQYSGGTMHIVTHDNIVVMDGTVSSANDIVIFDDAVEFEAGSYSGFVAPYLGNSELSAGKNMHIDFWYEGNTSSTRDLRVTLEGVRDNKVAFNVTFTSKVIKMRIWSGYRANAYSDYRLFWYMCEGMVSQLVVGDPIENGETVEVKLSDTMPFVYTGQHQTTAKVIEN